MIIDVPYTATVTIRTLYSTHAKHLHYYATWTKYYVVDNLYLHVHVYMRPVVCMSRIILCTCIVGMVDGRGYDGQQKYTISDACRPCHLILNCLTDPVTGLS